MKFDTVKSLVLLAGAGFVGWKIYQANKVVNNAIDSVSDTADEINQVRVSFGRSIGSSIFDLVN